MTSTRLAVPPNARRIVILLAISSFICGMFFTPTAKLFAAEDTASLTVIASGEFGQKEGVEVDIFSLSRELVAHTTSDANGQAKFGQLRPGAYTVELYYTATYGLALKEFWGALNVTLISGENETLLFSQLAPVLWSVGPSGLAAVGDKIGINVSVRQRASPLMRARVQFVMDRNCLPPYDYVAQSEESSLPSPKLNCGTFSPSEPGDYYSVIVVEAYYRESWVTTYQTDWVKTLKVELEHGRLIIDVEDPEQVFAVNGQVRLSLPHQGETIVERIVGQPSEPWFAAVFELPPGSYETIVSYIPDKPLLFDNGQTFELGRKSATVTIERDKDTLLTLAQAGLVVRVVNEEGHPVINAEVSLSLRDDNGTIWKLHGSESTTNDFGEVLYPHLTANDERWQTYLVDASWNAYVPFMNSEQHAVEETRELEIAPAGENEEWNTVVLQLPGALAPWPNEGGRQIAVFFAALASVVAIWCLVKTVRTYRPVRSITLVYLRELLTWLAELFCSLAFGAFAVLIMGRLLVIGGPRYLLEWMPDYATAFCLSCTLVGMIVISSKALSKEQSDIIGLSQSRVLMTNLRALIVITVAISTFLSLDIGLGLMNSSIPTLQMSIEGITALLFALPLVWSLHSYLNLERILLRRYKAYPLDDKSVEDQRLRSVIEEEASRLGLDSLPVIYHSRGKVAMPQVFGRKSAVIVIPDTLEKDIARAERFLGIRRNLLLKFVLLHELAHIRHKDYRLVSWGAVFIRRLPWWGLLAGILALGSVLYYRAAVTPNVDMSKFAFVMSFIFLPVLIGPVLTYLGHRMLTRHRELIADRRALLCLTSEETAILTDPKWDSASLSWMEALSYISVVGRVAEQTSLGSTEYNTLIRKHRKIPLHRISVSASEVVGRMKERLRPLFESHPSWKLRLHSFRDTSSFADVVAAPTKKDAVIAGIICSSISVSTLLLSMGIYAIAAPPSTSEYLSLLIMITFLFLVPLFLYTLIFGQPLRSICSFHYSRYISTFLLAYVYFITVWSLIMVPILVAFFTLVWGLVCWAIFVGLTFLLGLTMPAFMPGTEVAFIGLAGQLWSKMITGIVRRKR